MGKQFGYVRVSSKDQNEIRQLNALAAFGIPETNVYMDKQSGKNFDRPAWKQLAKKLKPGDLLVVKSIDRLGRNYDEILEQWRIITKEKRAAIVVLDMPLLDTGQSRDLTGTLIADIVLQLLSYVAQTEREFIRQRQAEGIAAAKARGVRFGRRAAAVPPEFPAVHAQWRRGAFNSRAAGARLHRDVRRNHLALGIALGAQVINERKAAFRRPAEPEMADHFHGQAPAREIIKPRLTLRA